MRSARLAGYLFGGAAALGAAIYVVIYLYRWQWQRTIICGVLLLVVEVLLLGLATLDRISRLEQRIRDGDRRQDEILAQLRQADREPGAGGGRATAGRPRFAWLGDGEGRTFVFVPVLMAAGVALSGLAWVVERVARATVRPTAQRRLAGRLAPLAAPPGGLHAPTPDLPDHPVLGRAKQLGALALAAAACVALFAGLQAMTETEPPEHGTGAATSLLFTVDGNGVGDSRTALAAEQMWERCRDATAVPLLQAGMTALDDGLFAATVQPSLSEHDELRLLGCLEDTTIDRVRLTVIGTGALEPS
ncbi:hypothetical protein [Streptomyces sp. URMC 129]|uniref:hypothetical protein n=1 Tax=Streptomyces sp. URMC 129 TaxID=3423407 RepID=UPI003F19B64B